MQLVGDIKCYYCGFISGELVSSDGQSLKNGTFRPALGVDPALAVKGTLRCARCGGPVFIDDVRTERPHPAAVTFERERPGRPRRSRTRTADSAGAGLL
jgi:DNA-directed RNA polymerase subunit RPC12/RpoP